MARARGSGWLRTINNELTAAGERGTYTAVAGDDTANEAVIDTGVTGATGFIVQIYRAGVLSNTDAVITLEDGVLTVADGASTYDVTADDVITWMVF